MQTFNSKDLTEDAEIVEDWVSHQLDLCAER
jgi:hypothetical protein